VTGVSAEFYSLRRPKLWGGGHGMSSQNTGITPLGPDDIMESPVATMWKWHVMNGLEWQPADTLEDSFIHKKIAIAILDKSHISKKTVDNGLLNKVRRHKHKASLVLYGDLLKVRDQQHEEATTPV